MPTTEQDLKKIAALAYIETDTDSSAQLAHDVSAMMAFVESLREINTSSIAPLLHPLDLHQRLRKDEVTEKSNVDQLASIAPRFANDLYLVPTVIETGK